MSKTVIENTKLLKQQIGSKAEANDVYTKNQADGKFATKDELTPISNKANTNEQNITTLQGQIANKADIGASYTKNESDDKFATKDSLNTVQQTVTDHTTKIQQVQTALQSKADANTVYTKVDADGKFATKQEVTDLGNSVLKTTGNQSANGVKTFLDGYKGTNKGTGQYVIADNVNQSQKTITFNFTQPDALGYVNHSTIEAKIKNGSSATAQRFFAVSAEADLNQTYMYVLNNKLKFKSPTIIQNVSNAVDDTDAINKGQFDGTFNPLNAKVTTLEGEIDTLKGKGQFVSIATFNKAQAEQNSFAKLNEFVQQNTTPTRQPQIGDEVVTSDNFRFIFAKQNQNTNTWVVEASQMPAKATSQRLGLVKFGSVEGEVEDADGSGKMRVKGYTDLKNTVTGHTTAIQQVQNTVGQHTTKLQSLETSVNSKADANSVYTKVDADNKFATKTSLQSVSDKANSNETKIGEIQTKLNTQVVLTSGNQTIDGDKTFSNGLILGNFKVVPEANAMRIYKSSAGGWLYLGDGSTNYLNGIDLNNRVQLQGVKDPTEDSQAANKRYVDTTIAPLNNFLSKLPSGCIGAYNVYDIADGSGGGKVIKDEINQKNIIVPQNDISGVSIDGDLFKVLNTNQNGGARKTIAANYNESDAVPSSTNISICFGLKITQAQLAQNTNWAPIICLSTGQADAGTSTIKAGFGLKSTLDSGHLTFELYGIRSRTSSNDVYKVDELVHYCWVYSDTNLKIYANGILVDTINRTGSSWDFDQVRKLLIGTQPNNLKSSSFDFDNLLIFNKALNDNEITSTYNAWCNINADRLKDSIKAEVSAGYVTADQFNTVSQKANANEASIQQINTTLGQKADSNSVYTKVDADNKFATKVELATKANSNDVYTKAQADGRYATQTDLNSKANDNAVVKLSGTQTVNGKKTFGDSIGVTTNYTLTGEAGQLRIQPTVDGKYIKFGNPTTNKYFVAVDLDNKVGVVGLKNPTNDNDAANKAYVDTKATELRTILNNKADATNVYTKQQADDKFETKANVQAISQKADTNETNIQTLQRDVVKLNAGSAQTIQDALVIQEDGKALSFKYSTDNAMSYVVFTKDGTTENFKLGKITADVDDFYFIGSSVNSRWIFGQKAQYINSNIHINDDAQFIHKKHLYDNFLRSNADSSLNANVTMGVNKTIIFRDQIKVGYGSGECRITSDDGSTKTLKFYGTGNNNFLNLDLGNKAGLTGLKTPRNNSDATNKQYVDTAVNACVKLNSSTAQTINSPINIANTLSIGAYKFSAEAGAVRFTPGADGKWMYFGDPNAGSNGMYFAGLDFNEKVNVQGIKDPTQETQAANKRYVDEKFASVNPGNITILDPNTVPSTTNIPTNSFVLIARR